MVWCWARTIRWCPGMSDVIEADEVAHARQRSVAGRIWHKCGTATALPYRDHVIAAPRGGTSTAKPGELSTCQRIVGARTPAERLGATAKRRPGALTQD